MNNIKHQTKKELRQLPLILCKLTGGITAVLGFTSFVVMATRKSNATSGKIILTLVITLTGIAVFLLSSRILTKHSVAFTESARPTEKNSMSILSWILLFVFAAIFLAWVYFMTA